MTGETQLDSLLGKTRSLLLWLLKLEVSHLPCLLMFINGG